VSSTSSSPAAFAYQSGFGNQFTGAGQR